jgi:hypothetical protein
MVGNPEAVQAGMVAALPGDYDAEGLNILNGKLEDQGCGAEPGRL